MASFHSSRKILSKHVVSAGLSIHYIHAWGQCSWPWSRDLRRIVWRHPLENRRELFDGPGLFFTHFESSSSGSPPLKDFILLRFFLSYTLSSSLGMVMGFSASGKRRAQPFQPLLSIKLCWN